METSKAPLPLAVTLQCFAQVFSPEIGPERRRCVVFTVSRLPEQEVTDTHLPGRTNNHIRVREIAGIQVGTYQLLGDGIRITHVGDNLANRIYQFGPATVIKADVEANAGVIARKLYRVPHSFLNIRGEILQTTKMTQAHSIAVQFF